MDPKRRWELYEDRYALVEAVGGDAELAFRIFVSLGEGALAWLDVEIPALRGKTPRRCLASAPGRRLLRRVVARFPR